jgi:hypothetical protein
MIPVNWAIRLLDQKGNMIRINFLIIFQHSVGTSPNRPNHLRKSFHNDLLTQNLMGETKSAEDSVVKKVAERPMADIVEQTRKAQELFYVKP